MDTFFWYTGQPRSIQQIYLFYLNVRCTHKLTVLNSTKSVQGITVQPRPCNEPWASLPHFVLAHDSWVEEISELTWSNEVHKHLANYGTG
jgi:hypothetical protein